MLVVATCVPPTVKMTFNVVRAEPARVCVVASALESDSARSSCGEVLRLIWGFPLIS